MPYIEEWMKLKSSTLLIKKKYPVSYVKEKNFLFEAKYSANYKDYILSLELRCLKSKTT